jgi:type IV pilus assembly protein PilY1
MSSPRLSSTRYRPLMRGLATALAAMALAPSAFGQLTDIAPTPLTTSAPNQVKPNLLFILDDSGSMASDFMPDDADFATAKYGRYAAQCNGLAYNPGVTYRLPVDSTGADLAAGSYNFIQPSSLPNIRTVSGTPTIATGSVTLQLTGFNNNDYGVNDYVTVYSNTDTSRWMLGIITNVNAGSDQLTINFTETSGATGTLSNPRIGDGHHRPFYYTYTPTTGSPTALSYTYTTGGVVTSTTFYGECNSVVGSAPGNARFTRVLVTSASADIQNYRNWYTYYRNRMLMAKSATSLAFRSIGDRFRVGFTTISSTRVSGSDFVDVADFDTTQKGTFYTNLSGASPGGYTPLRGALSKAGRYYAKAGTQADGTAQTYDPVQFSCQKNFAILTTDGYWNTDNEVTGTGAGSYGPDRLDRTDVGQQDGGGTPRPMLDGATSVTQTRTSALQQRTVYPWQTANVTLQQRSGSLQTRTSNNSGASWGSWTNTSSCAWDNSGGTRRQCSYGGSGGWSNVSSCTVSGNTGTSGTWTTTSGTECQYSTPAYTPAASCTPVNPSTGPNYTVATATLCNATPTYSAWASAGSCDASSSTQCQYTSWTAWSNISSCTAVPQSVSPTYTVGTARECQVVSTGGVSNSLADVAMYYYNTDLRDAALNNCTLGSGTNVCTNNVPPRGSDTATHQHMSTFTVGMGVNGTLRYASNYTSGGSSDYNDIVQGTRDWPDPIATTTASRIDDLWHAAVNGRGQYFNAGDPASLASGLTAALTAIDAQTGSGSGAAASTLQPVAGDNSLFIAKYTTVHWTGELVSRSIDPQSGAISATDNWSAEQLLDARVGAGTARNIYYMQRTGGANTGALRSFTYANLNADSLGGHFSSVCSKAVPLSQCTDSGYDVAGANSGANMVSYLRGTAFGIYRARQHILGDIVGGAPVYVRRPSFQYTENGYAAFATANASRTGVVYAAANDGMLHAFNGATGQEMWAYVPSMVMDRMYRLADNDYANRHEFFVNGAPVVGDIWVPGSPGTWKTILVGGLGAGGQGYYALDITDPNNPQALWEFSNDSLGGANNLGLTFGNPVITKRADGTWVVAFTSGYNNVVSGGDGNGRLFVVNANTGERLVTIATETSTGVPAGTASAPSGLGKLNAWVESTIDNTARRYYAGDLLGNLWRFDIDNLVAPNGAALRLAYLRAGSPAAGQPITTQPALGMVDYGGSQYPVVYIGTGRLLGLSDLSSTAVQSVYAIKDPLTNTPLGDVHASSTMVAQVLSQASANAPRTVTNNAVDWSTGNGWYVDLIGSGERVNVDMQVIFQTLNVASNTPNNDACTAGGSSYLYHFNLNTGSAPIGSADGVVGTWLGGTMVVGMSYLTLQQPGTTEAGTGRTITVIVDNRGLPRTDDVPPPPPPAATGRRTSWRELVQ